MCALQWRAPYRGDYLSGMPTPLFRHPILDIEGFDVSTKEGVLPFIRIRAPDWVNVVATTDDGQVVLVHQHRWGIDETTLEIPGGVIDPGEEPMTAAVRELAEETGYGDGDWESLGWVWSNPAIQTNRTWLFRARAVRCVGAPQPDPAEEIEVRLVPLAKIAELLRTGGISHALAVVSLQRVLLQL